MSCDISLVSLSNETQLVTKGANLGARTITIFLRTDGLSVVSGASGWRVLLLLVCVATKDEGWQLQVAHCPRGRRKPVFHPLEQTTLITRNRTAPGETNEPEETVERSAKLWQRDINITAGHYCLLKYEILAWHILGNKMMLWDSLPYRLKCFKICLVSLINNDDEEEEEDDDYISRCV